MFKLLAAASVIGLALQAAPAEARRGARAVVTVDNDLYGSVNVFVNGSYFGKVRGGTQVDLVVPPGTHAIRLVQRRHNCVLAADIVDLPRGSRVEYDVNQRCNWRTGFSGAYDHHRHGSARQARWANPDRRWVAGRHTVINPDPVYVCVREHYGLLRAPIVLTEGPRAASAYRGGRGRGGVAVNQGPRGGWDDGRNGRRDDRRRWDDDDDDRRRDRDRDDRDRRDRDRDDRDRRSPRRN